MKKTPLHQKHLDLGAKMAEYAGFDMPIEYEGVKEEILAVRESCGIFDVSHMGQIRVQGESADAFLNWLLSRPIDGMKTELITYAILVYEDAGVVDDLLVYRFAEAGDYWLVVNAANKDKDVKYLHEMRDKFYEKFPEYKQDVEIIDESEQYGQVAVQGPEAAKLMEKYLDDAGFSAEDKAEILAQKNYRSYRQELASGLSIVISRTGYTGEDGYEIYVPAEQLAEIWDKFIAYGAKPCGLGSRDTLRLEAGMPLYGHEMSADINPLDGGQKFAVRAHEPFIASAAMVQKRKLIPLVSESRSIPREGYTVKYEGKEVGVITSGTFSPTIGKGIAYAMVDLDFPDDAEEFMVEIHRKDKPFRKTSTPFYK